MCAYVLLVAASQGDFLVSKPQPRVAVILPLALCLGILLFWGSLFLIQGVAQAAPPAVSMGPNELRGKGLLIVTGTKTAVPSGPVSRGSVLTYTIVFSSDDAASSVVVTDRIPAQTTYKPNTITGTPAASITVKTSATVLTWTVSNLEPDRLVTLTYAVTVNNTANEGSNITNTAWISRVRVTHITTVRTETISSTTYLPAILKNSRCARDSYEPNDTLETAKRWTFGSGASISGNFCLDYDDPEDYFVLNLNNLAAGKTLEVWLYPPSTADYDVYIYKGGVLQQPYGNHTGFGVAEHIAYTIPSSDTYYIDVYPYNKASGDSYSLKVAYP